MQRHAASGVLPALAIILSLVVAVLVIFEVQGSLSKVDNAVASLQSEVGTIKEELKSLKSNMTMMQTGQTQQKMQLMPQVEFALETSLKDGKLSFVGVGGEISGMANPELRVNVGDVVNITIINGNSIEHDFTVEHLNVMSDHLMTVGEKTTVIFRAEQVGTHRYYCSVPGHRAAGMEGELVVTQEGTVQTGS